MASNPRNSTTVTRDTCQTKVAHAAVRFNEEEAEENLRMSCQDLSKSPMLRHKPLAAQAVAEASQYMAIVKAGGKMAKQASDGLVRDAPAKNLMHEFNRVCEPQKRFKGASSEMVVLESMREGSEVLLTSRTLSQPVSAEELQLYVEHS